MCIMSLGLNYEAMRLKRWESPRKQGRNDKGKGGSARKRQLKKQQQMLRQKLKGNDKPGNQSQNNRKRKQGEETLLFPLFFGLIFQKYSNLQSLAKS